MSDLFGNSTLPGWQMFTPQSYALAAAPANAQIGKSFSEAFQSGQKNKLGQDQLSQQGQQFRDELIEKKRQFDILHPDPTRPWNSPASGGQGEGGWNSSGGDVGGGWEGGVEGFEEGGRPPVGQPSIVGEGGPELFVPDKPGTIVPNDKIGMTYDRNGTGSITPTGITSTSSVGDGVSAKVGAGWNGEQKPNWLNAPPAPNWRATNALDAIGKVTQAKSFDDLTEIQKQNPEAGMYPQFQSALQQKSLILQRGAEIDLRQKTAENNTVEAKARLDQVKKFNDAFLPLPPEFHSILGSLGKAAFNDNGTYSPAAQQVLKAGQSFMEQQLAAKAAAAKLVPNKMDAKGTTFGQPAAGSEGADFAVKTYYNESGAPSFEALVDNNTGKVHASHVVAEHVPPDVKAQQENNKSQIEAAQKEFSNSSKIAQSTSASADDKAQAARSALAARTQLQKLWEDRVKLSTNWMNKASAPAAPAEAAKGTNAVVTSIPGDPAQRKSGTIYQTPKGNLKWTGTGWVQP